MADRLTESPERLRLGIDLDGVVADFNAGWMARLDEELGTTSDPGKVATWDGLHDHGGFASMDEFWAWARRGPRTVFRDLPVMPGALEALERLAAEHRVIILTARFDWAIADTLAWLADRRVPAREVHFVEDKARVRCDVYLDDAPYQLEALVAAANGATVCRAVRSWNEPVPGALDVADWPAFEGVVARVSAGR